MQKICHVLFVSLLSVFISCNQSEIYCFISDSLPIDTEAGNTSTAVIENNDLLKRLVSENFKLHLFGSVEEAVDAAPENSGLLVLSGGYPEKGVTLDEKIIDKSVRKSLKVFIEYPDQIGNYSLTGRDTLDLERIVVCDSLADELAPMDLLSFNRCVVSEYDTDLSDKFSNPLMVAAKVAGFDTAVYGLEATPTIPLLARYGENFMVSFTRMSQYAHSRYIPENKVKSLFEYILSWVCGGEIEFESWDALVHPMYQQTESLPAASRRDCVAKGIEWYYNSNVIVDSSWKENWADLYIGDGTMPVGPEVPSEFKDGDGSLGVLEGHMSTILHDGSQMYRYWMRADVQGESSYAFASSSHLLGKPSYADVASNLLKYAFDEYRDGPRNDPESPSYGLLGWARTHKGTYYGDDNARFILGALGAVAFMDNHQFDQKIVESVVGNFRTSGQNGFRGCTLYENDIQQKGWCSYYNSGIDNPHPHFEAWLWACYLWLYDQTGWEPLLERTVKGIKITMDGYPDEWSWTNGIQQERARMILPLAWLYRVSPTEEHEDWLDYMMHELLKNQVDCGGIQEELGDPSKSSFGKTPSNDLYGVTEAPLIFDNGDPVADMLYTTNFAFVGLCEAAYATGKDEYKEALEKMSDFLVRIQVESDEFKSVDGAWFRAFDYQSWNYWASNADAGWGAWSTLTGWIQGWIVGTQVLLEEDTSLWDLISKNRMSGVASDVISDMMEEYQ